MNTASTNQTTSLGKPGETIVWSPKIYGFRNPFIPVIETTDDNENLENIKIVDNEKNIYYLQRESQNGLNKTTFFKSVDDLLRDKTVSLDPYSHDPELPRGSTPIQSNIDVTPTVLKYIYFLEQNLEKYPELKLNSNQNENQSGLSNEERKRKELLYDLKAISLLTMNEYNEFVEQYYQDLTKETKNFKFGMSNIRSKYKNKLPNANSLNELLDIDSFRMFFITFILYLRLNALFFLALVKNYDKLNESIIKDILKEISEMELLKGDEKIKLKELKYADIIPTTEDLTDERKKTEASSYKINILMRFLLIVGFSLYNYFGSSEIDLEKNSSNEEYFDSITKSITTENPLFQRLFREDEFTTVLIEKSLADILKANYFGDNINNVLSLIFKIITFYQLYSTISWFFINTTSIYDIVGFDTVYDKPLLEQFCDSSYIGNKLENSGRRTLSEMTPISDWTLFWSKDGGKQRHVRIFNIQNWSFSVVGVNYDSENFYPIALGSNGNNMQSIQSGTIPANLIESGDDYQFNFLTRYSVKNPVTPAYYGTDDNFMRKGGKVGLFLESIGWKESNNKNREVFNSKKYIGDIVSELIRTLQNQNTDFIQFQSDMLKVNDYKLEKYVTKSDTKESLVESLEEIRKELENKKFRKLFQLDKYLKKKLDTRGNLGYYTFYDMLKRVEKYQNSLRSSYGIIHETPFVSVSAEMIEYTVLNYNFVTESGKDEGKMPLFPVKFRESINSNKLINSEFFITVNGIVIRGKEVSQGKMIGGQISVQNIEFALVRKVISKDLETSVSNKNNDDDYVLKVCNSEFYVVKMNPGSSDICVIATIKLVLDERSNNSESQNGGDNPFTPRVTKNNIRNESNKIMKKIKDHKDLYIDIKLGDIVISPVDLSLMIALSRYLMTSTGTEISFAKKKFDINKMTKYESIFDKKGNTKYDSPMVEKISKYGIKSSLVPLDIFNPNINLTVLEQLK